VNAECGQAAADGLAALGKYSPAQNPGWGYERKGFLRFVKPERNKPIHPFSGWTYAFL